jgi:membrane associated rhomboid family serine protease
MENDSGHDLPVTEEWLNIDPAQICESPNRLTEKKARLWSLVLDSRFVPCQLLARSGEWFLLTPPDRFVEACAELRRFEIENRNWPPPTPPQQPVKKNFLATLSILFLLATFHNITRLDSSALTGYRIDWLNSGSGHADKILAGEWWRLVTALTLHSDVVHLLSNLSIGGIIVFFLCRELGSGLAWFLLLAAGICGNALNALIQQSGHISIGASTAVFGAIGILSSLSRGRPRQQRWRRWGLPFAAALALLAILGTEGKQTDLGAHFFGFLSGIFIGVVTDRIMNRHLKPGPAQNALLAILSGLIIAVAWLAALAK